MNSREIYIHTHSFKVKLFQTRNPGHSLIPVGYAGTPVIVKSLSSLLASTWSATAPADPIPVYTGIHNVSCIDVEN